MPYIVFDAFPKSTGRTLRNCVLDPETGFYYAEVGNVKNRDVEATGAEYLEARGRAERAEMAAQAASPKAETVQ